MGSPRAVSIEMGLSVRARICRQMSRPSVSQRIVALNELTAQQLRDEWRCDDSVRCLDHFEIVLDHRDQFSEAKDRAQGDFARVVIFGAAGATGRALVTQALTKGHQVTAFVRTPAKFDLK